MTNIKVTQSSPQESPLPTNYMIPNGMEQSFMLINFYDLDDPFEGERVTETETEIAPSPGFTILVSLIGLLVAIPTIRRMRKF